MLGSWGDAPLPRSGVAVEDEVTILSPLRCRDLEVTPAFLRLVTVVVVNISDMVRCKHCVVGNFRVAYVPG